MAARHLDFARLADDLQDLKVNNNLFKNNNESLSLCSKRVRVNFIRSLRYCIILYHTRAYYNDYNCNNHVRKNGKLFTRVRK